MIADEGWAPGRVRIDDLRLGSGWEFRDHVDAGVARTVDEVVDCLRRAERAAVGGRWVVCAIAYEAAAAFDPAIAAALGGAGHAADDRLPLVWWASFGQRVPVAPASPPQTAPALGDEHRLHGADWFRAGVAAVREAIADGDVYQVNLADRVRGSYTGDPMDLYRAMATTQGGEYNAYVEMGDTVVVSASPELFLRVDGDEVTTRPMKGTARRRARPDDDRAAAVALAASEKDRAENVMIVDLLRNDLSRVATPGGVGVPHLFDVERYSTVWQLTSTVRARLRPDIDLVGLLAAVFPCGSVTGAPKVAAMAAINRMEAAPRGIYCGSVGVLEPVTDGVATRPNSSWSVAIRTALVDRRTGTVEFGAGGGVTTDSDPEAEEDELRAKTMVLADARPSFELFETIRVEHGAARHLERHLARLAISAAHLDFAFDEHAARCAVAATLAGAPPAAAQVAQRLRLLLAIDGSTRAELLEVVAVDSAPVRLAVAATRVRADDVFCAHKTTYRRRYEAARSARPDVDDVILVNERGELVETTIANLLCRIDGRWFTPALTSGGLPGVGRSVLIDDGAVEERVLTIDDLRRCEALEVVSALRGRRPAILVV